MYLLSIPYKSKPGSKLPIFGIAKYIINFEGKVIQEYCELKEYTKFKGKLKYGSRFSKKKIQSRKRMMIDDSSDLLLSTRDVNRINDEFRKELNTFLSHDSYITGSNPGGSKSNKKRTPYIIDGGRYNQLIFTHFFNDLREKGATRVKADIRNNLDQYKEINLEKYFSFFPNHKEEFENKNKELQLALNSNDENETFEIDTSEESKKYIDLILDVSYLKDSGLTKDEINEKRVTALRRIFKNRMRKLEETDQIFGNKPESICEAAHIFPVYKIRKFSLEKWYMIADNNNGLNLPIEIHKMYDKHFFHFNSEGKIIYNNEQYEEQFSKLSNLKAGDKIKAKNLGKKIPYIKMYNSL